MTVTTGEAFRRFGLTTAEAARSFRALGRAIAHMNGERRPGVPLKRAHLRRYGR